MRCIATHPLIKLNRGEECHQRQSQKTELEALEYSEAHSVQSLASPSGTHFIVIMTCFYEIQGLDTWPCGMLRLGGNCTGTPS